MDFVRIILVNITSSIFMRAGVVGLVVELVDRTKLRLVRTVVDFVRIIFIDIACLASILAGVVGLIVELVNCTQL